ncbi:GerAB/ArcD/ProY family transporter [Paenibacillus sp. JDR-2]|uniref:GerAB/ArcD/ProY family transporter n=1 Tax=Paenibacillus sp. (strain JDR-2) TaxID=324057 RepID=UPI0001668F6D|nr:endospore germination permease [Paenibacillus sp. JDR-2]ACS99594.1 spore germination protein [Paenibacillus sp. JDR-2]
MKPAISTLQTVALIQSAITPTLVLAIPSVMVTIAHHDAWISGIIAIAAGMIMALGIGLLCKANKGQLFVEWMESSFGRPIGMVIGLFIGIYYFNSFCVIVRSFADFIADIVLDSTPLFMLTAIMVVVAAFTVMQGIEAIARSAFLVLILILLIVPVSVFVLYTDIDFKRLIPLFDTSTARLAIASFPPIGLLSEVAVLLLINPYMKKPASAVKAGLLGTFLGSSQLVLIILLSLTIFGQQLVPFMSYAFVNVMAIVEVGEFLERIEIFTVSVWVLTMYVKLAVFLFAAVHCLFHSLRLRSERHTVMGLSILAIVTAAGEWPQDMESTFMTTLVNMPVLLITNILLPILIALGLLVTRGKRKQQRGGQKP